MNTTVENNKLIAVFLGLKLTTDGIQALYYEGNSLKAIPKYNSDWNWLMEVVEKIESLGFILKIYGVETTFLKRGTFNENIWNDGFIGKDRKESIYNACIAFINWYNEQK